MSDLQALDQIIAPGLNGPSSAVVIATLVLSGIYLGWALRRLPPRRAALTSVGAAVIVLVASWASWTVLSLAWPAWPAWIALVFGHLGHALTRSAARAARGDSAAPKPAAANDTAPAPDRTTLGRYLIDRQLGRGAMGAVYLGHDPKIGRQVAIKTMALSQEFDGAELIEARSRFFREAETAGRLQHRDIVTIFDAGEDQDLAYIAMEYLKGHDLQRYTTGANLLPVPVVLDIVARVADALAYAHSQGVVHRDIKPANVMFDPVDDSVKVTDFGIARITDSSRTRTGMVLGTPSYMSPEQMAGRRVDGRSDLYSLGAMLFQLLSGRLPHSAESMAKLMYQIANEPAPDIRSLRPELPEPLANVVALALEKRPEVRYADGRQMAQDLRTVQVACQELPQVQRLEAQPLSPPETDGFAKTLKLSRTDPRHNSSP